MFRKPLPYIFAILAITPLVSGDDDLESLDEAIVEVRETSIWELQRRVRDLEKMVADLSAALEALRQELASDEGSASRALLDENERLRKSVRLLYGGRVENLPNVPIPNRDLLEEVLSTEDLKAQYEEKLEALTELEPELELDTSTAGGTFTVIKEWGRSPEAVAQMNGNYSTLKGMSIFVQPGTPRDEMTDYALALREQYQDYDNVNIEIFDQKKAADEYAEKGTLTMAFRVMSVSKHAKSGRDVVLIGRGRSMEVIR